MNFKQRLKLAGNLVLGRGSSNLYNSAFFKWVGLGFSSYDANGKTYVDKGFNQNPFVYSVVNQIATKASSIPSLIKKVDDSRAKQKIDSLLTATKYNLSPTQKLRLSKLNTKAYSDNLKEKPIDRPNPLQTWKEFIELYEVFLKVTGNAYIYLASPDSGLNKGEPIAWYLLPSHLMQIVLKEEPDMLTTESPVSHYILIEGNQFVKFPAEDVVHIKYANPNFDMTGSHLYGLSPLRSALKNMQSSNLGLDLNIKTLQNGGAYGFFYADSPTPLTEAQGKAFKERLEDMSNNPDKLSKIAASSIKMGFQRMSLTSDELKPFDFLSFDLKQICAVFGWDDKLMGNDAGAKYDNYLSAQKKCLIGSILPDLKLLEDAINNEILPRYKGYDNCEWSFDISELPEMQQNMTELSEWTTRFKDKGIMTGNEVRTAAGLPKSDDPIMDKLTTNEDLLTLEQSLDDLPTVI